MIDLIKTSLVNGFIGSAGATTALFIYFVIKDRWF